MSTILDALKKVEQERDTDTTAAHQRQLEALHPTADKRQKGRARNRLIGGLIVVLFALMGGITFYLFRGNPHSDTSPTAAAEGDRPAPTIAPKKTTKSARPKSPETRSDKTRRRPASRSAQVEPPRHTPPRNAINRKAQASPTDRRSGVTSVEPKAPFRRRPASDNISATAMPKTMPVPKERPAPRSRVTARPPVPVPSKTVPAYDPPQQRQSTPTTPSHSHIERLADGSLNVQAIAWSSTPEERMAVINTKIVREGNSVDDYTLVTIGQDDVVVRKGGRQWRVVIGRP